MDDWCCRWKNFDFPSSTRNMRDDAYKYLKATFVKDWLPVAPAKKRVEPDPMPSAPAAKKLKVCGVGGMLDLLSYAEDDANVETPTPPAEVELHLTKEVDDYLSIPQAASDANVLDWWKMHSASFPNLCKMARVFHAIPASSAGVERLFSAAGKMHDDMKKNTKESTLEINLMVHKNA